MTSLRGVAPSALALALGLWFLGRARPRVGRSAASPRGPDLPVQDQGLGGGGAGTGAFLVLTGNAGLQPVAGVLQGQGLPRY